MYDIDFKNIKKNYLFGFIFLIVGIIILGVFLIFPLLAINEKNKYDSQTDSNSVTYKTSENDDGKTMYTPIYKFEVDGRQYSCEANYSTNIKPSKDIDIIYYDKNNPENCMPNIEMDFYKFFILFAILPVIFIIIGIIFILNVRKKVKKAKYLSEYGQLIKNLPYRMVNSNVTINNRRLLAIEIDYTLPDGTTKKLVGNPRYDHKTSDEDNLVDLLIDPNDPNNYYIDFNISPK